MVPCLWLCIVILPWSTGLSQSKHKCTFPALLFTSQELMAEGFGWWEAWCSDRCMCSCSLVHPLSTWGSLRTGLFGRAGLLFIMSDFPNVGGQKQLPLKHCFTARTPFSTANAIHNFCFQLRTDCSSRCTNLCLMTAVRVLMQLYWDPLCQIWAFLSTNGHTQGELVHAKMEWQQARLPQA